MAFTDRLHNRGSISTGYEIANSLKLEADNAERMQRSYEHITSTGTPTSTKIATISFWLKRTELHASGDLLCFLADSNYTWIGFSNDGIYVLGSTAGINLRSSGKFRDTSAWYHIVVAFDTTQSTASNRVKVYVNGEQWTEFGVSANYGTQNNDIDLYDLNTSHYLGWSDAQSQSGYYSEFYLIDGQALAPTEFGEFDSDSGIWKPKAYDGTFGVQGYHLDFEDSSALGADVSGNGNNFAYLYNITSADQATDTPTNNFCTFNAIQNYDGKHTYTNGATVFGLNTDSGSGNTALGTIAVTKGKWYAEFKPTGTTSTSYPHNVFLGVGVMDQLQLLSTGFLGGKANSTAQGMGYYNANGQGYRNTAGFSWGNSYTANDIIGVALDYRSDGTAHMYVAKNGTWQNSSDPANNTNPMSMNYGSAFADGVFLAFGASIYIDDGVTIECNFGGYTPSSISSAETDANGYGTFEYAPPTGYYALCTKNLAEYG